MKFILIALLFVFAACGNPEAERAKRAGNLANEQIKEKNKLTSAKNETIEITKLAQKLEQNGRDLQGYRESSGAESDRQCQELVNARSEEIIELETRVNKLPETYKTKLLPIVGEVRECVSCAKKGLDDCKKARASINQVIKEIF